MKPAFIAKHWHVFMFRKVGSGLSRKTFQFLSTLLQLLSMKIAEDLLYQVLDKRRWTSIPAHRRYITCMLIAPFLDCFLLFIGVAISQAVSAVVQYLLHLHTLEQMRQYAVVRPDTQVQFQRHVFTPYIAVSEILPLRVCPFSCAVVHL